MGDPENQRFLRNSGLFKVKVTVKAYKGGIPIFSTWRTQIHGWVTLVTTSTGSRYSTRPDSLRVGVPGSTAAT